jgi:hypothetical protein
MVINSNKYLDSFISICIGAAAYLIILDYSFLDPENINWLLHHDFSTSYLGWEFYRRDEVEGMVIGANPTYGLEMSSSILHSGSLPLLSIPLKFLSEYLPDKFQFFGVWLLACFILQSYFAWKLVSLISESRLLIFSGTLLFVFTPSFLHQIPHHLNLSAHWVILASVYFLFAYKFNVNKALWPLSLLVLISLFIHSYIFIMIFSLWLVLILDDLLDGKRQVLPWFLFVMALVFYSMWQIGYFLGGDSSACCYGRYGMNIFSIFDPRDFDGDSYSWSYFMPDIPGQNGWGVGFNYLGLGVILLLISTWRDFFNKTIKAIKANKYRNLIIMLLLLTLFSITHRIGVMNFYIKLPLFDSLVDFLGALRGSGRFFWPVHYILLFSIIYIFSKRTKAAPLLLLFFALVQILDTSSAWLQLQENAIGKKYQHQEYDFSSALGDAKYTEIKIVPFENHSKGWEKISLYALKQGMSTNVVYLARPSVEKVREYNQNFLNSIQFKTYNKNTMYILSDEYFDIVSEAIDLKDMKLIKVNGLNLFLPLQ